MSEPVGRRRELHRHEQVAAVLDPPVPRPVRHHVREDGRVADLGQEIRQDDPLVATAHLRPNGIEVAARLVDKAVVGLEEGEVQLRDDQVLVVARISDQGGPVRRRVLAPVLPRQIVRVGLSRRAGERRVRAVQVLDRADLHLARIGVVARRRAFVDAVEVEPQRARVPEAGERRKRRKVQGRERRHARRGLVEGDVVIQELAEIGVDGRDGAVARAFRAPDGLDLGRIRHDRAESSERLDRGAFGLEDVRLVLLEFGKHVPEARRRRGNADADGERP